MADFYLEHPEELKGQPKRTIADYVEENGILVAKRFASLEEARKSHKKIVLRSEHTQEYDGASGLLDSFSLSFELMLKAKEKGLVKFCPKGLKSVEEVKEAYLSFLDKSEGTPAYKQYCGFLGMDDEEFAKNISFSVWEALGGYNRTVVADSAIPNRYHITACCYKDDFELYNYTIFEKGIEKELANKLTPELRDGIEGLVNDYETIRNMDRFDANHCPIMEFQTVNGKNYFLQYHKGRDFKAVDFSLTRKPKKGEKTASFARGATPKEGAVIETSIVDVWNYKLSQIKEGAFNVYSPLAFSEIAVRRLKLQMLSMTKSNNLDYYFGHALVGHLNLSKLFKPEVSIVYGEGFRSFAADPEEFEKRWEKFRKTGEVQCIDLYVISDGRKAYIKRV